jgi:hypothetical protein
MKNYPFLIVLIILAGFLFGNNIYADQIILPVGETGASDGNSLPYIDLVAPNGGESWALGSVQNIVWTSSRLSNSIRITLWKDGIKVGLIATGVDPVVGFLPWLVGTHTGGVVAAGSGYTIKIKEISTTVSDISDAAFDIIPAIPPVINNVMPSGVTLPIGSPVDITWETSGAVGPVKLSLWKDGMQVGVIAYGLPSALLSYEWLAGQFVDGSWAQPGTGYFVRVKEIDTLVLDESDIPIELTPPPQPLKVVSPNGGEDLVIDSNISIFWDVFGLLNNLKITLWKDGALIGAIAHDIPPTPGVFSWNVGQYMGGMAPVGSGYTIKIKELGTAVVDESDGPFNIILPPPLITVISPNGNETWSHGTSKNITWVSENLSANIKISLYQEGTQVGVIASDVDPSLGSYTWTVGEYLGGTVPPGVDFTIKIKEMGTTTMDESDLPFEITQPTASWTFMVYLCGDNDLEGNGIDDFLEMAAVGSTDDVNIIVQFDRSPSYDARYGDWTDTKRFHVTTGMTPTEENALVLGEVEDPGEADMGDPATLINFVDWTKINYPAEKYALVLWDHGDGWRTIKSDLKFKAVCGDESSENYLTMAELRSALEAVGGAHLIGFDACLMGMVEVAYEIKNHGQVMVGSEYRVPATGWPYNTILSDLTGNPSGTPTQLGKSIVTRYYSSYAMDFTMSALDLTKMDALNVAISTFAQIAITFWDVDQTAVRTAALGVMIAIDNTIIKERHGVEWPGAHGLAIYFPSNLDSFDSDYNSSTLRFLNDGRWDEFLSAFLNTMLGSWIDVARGLTQEFYYPEHVDLYHFCLLLQ